MAFATKYQVQFADTYGVVWKILIQEDGFGGSITDLVATGSPLKIEFNSSSDEFNDVIRPSKAVFSVQTPSDFGLLDLYSDEDMHFKVLIYYASTLYWSGFVITGEYQEPYDCLPYPVTITAIDGLNYLKNILYDDAGTYYDGRTLESQIILDILAKIQVTTFTEYINIYEETMDDAVADSPLDQIKLDVDIFRDMYCWDVLEEVLKKYNACIRQSLGVLNIYRPVELVGATVYGRIFTGPTTKSDTSFIPAQDINRTGVASNLCQFPGSTVMVKCAMKKISLFQDFGYKESWIENYRFLSDTYIGSPTFKYNDWTYSGSGISFIGNVLPGEKEGLPMLAATGSPNAYNVSQSFGPYALNSANSFKIEFDYLTYNPINTNNVTIWVMIKADDGNYWLKIQDDITAIWDTSAAYITFTEATIIGSSGWKTFSRVITGIPLSGSYTIYIHPPNGYAGSIVAYKNIKFYSTSDSIVTKTYKQSHFPFIWSKWKRTHTYFDAPEITQKEYVVANAINGKEILSDYLLGDVQDTDTNINNIIEQFGGSLAVVATIGYTGSTDKVDTITINPGGSGSGTVSAGGVSRTITWTTDESTTIDGFLASESAYFTGMTLAKTSASTFTITASYNFTDADISASIGSAVVTQPFVPGDPVYGLVTTQNWNTRGGSEDDPLLQIVASETAYQYSRPKQLIQMNISDIKNTGPVLNTLGYFSDSLNEFIAGTPRKFVFNRGEFDVKKRLWNADLMEIIFEAPS